jgi:murein DD-endopeptidase MepM/ murein hydrolase activator NlpD
VRRLIAAFVTIAVTVALSIGVLVSLAFAEATTTDTTDDTTTTTTTSPPDTTPTTTTTQPDQGVITPPDQGVITPPDTSPDTTPTTEPPTTAPAGPPSTEPPPPPPPDAPPVTTHDNDIYVGTISTLNGAQRAAIEAFLAATDRLGRAQTALATAQLIPPTPNTKTDTVRTPSHASPSGLALIDSAHALDRAVKRVALRAQETLGITAAAAEVPPDPIAVAQAAVDAAQIDLDRATNDLRAAANGDALITALLTGKPPAGDGLAQRIANAQVGQGNPPALEAIFALPIPGAPIVSAYGFRIDPLSSGTVGFHPGVDISATQGTPILAAAAGTVISAGDEGGYGNAVILDHGDSLATLYGHMVRVAVNAGQHVEAGDVIGYVGSTGKSTGPHLHFEVRIHGVTVDPLPTFKS